MGEPCKEQLQKKNVFLLNFFHFSLFLIQFLSNLDHVFYTLFFSLLFAATSIHHLVLFLFCILPLLCFHIIPSSSFVVLCHSFLHGIVCLQPPYLLAALISPPLYPNYEMFQSWFRCLLVKKRRWGWKKRGDNVIVVLDGVGNG